MNIVPSTTKPTLVIGDCHGHLDRLEALLTQEGIIGECHPCEGTGDGALEGGFCEHCDGTGIARNNHDVEVVQLGDLGHFGRDTVTADRLTWKFGPEWLDVILWGNHDRAVIDRRHSFGGYVKPSKETEIAITNALDFGQLKLAYVAHGFLLTHAGLHKVFQHNKVSAEIHNDPQAFADWMNDNDEMPLEDIPHRKAYLATRDAISDLRGGPCNAGGILWRDAREKLYPFRQVFGHTAKRDGTCRTYESKQVGNSYCIDVGDQHNGRLMGMWLPDERVVEVKLDKPWAEHP